MKTNLDYSYTDIDIDTISKLSIYRLKITKEKVFNDILDIYEKFCSALKYKNIELKETDLEELYSLIIGDLKERVKQDPIAISEEFIYSISKSFKVIFYYRIAHLIFNLKIPLNLFDIQKYCAFSIAEYAAITCSIEIHPQAIIGKNFVIDHGVNTLIGATSEIGDNCTILQNVVLGARKITFNKKEKRHPTIGNNVHISGGVRILGPITIGDDVSIYPDCVITENVPNRTKIKLNKTYIVTKLK